MPHNPDEYFAYCVEQAGPLPWLHFVRGALKMKGAGFGSKSSAAFHGWQAMGDALVALNGAPLAYFGGMTRDETHRFKSDDRPASEVPDALAELERRLSAPDLTAVVNAAFAVMDSDGGDLMACVAKLGAALDAAFPDRVEAPELGTLDLTAETLNNAYGEPEA